MSGNAVFNLDLPTLQELQNGNERKLGVHIRFFSTLKQSDIALGYDSNLRINGKPVDLTKVQALCHSIASQVCQCCLLSFVSFRSS